MRNLKMRKVAKQIIEAKGDDDIIRQLLDQFYKIMRDNKIKQGEWSKDKKSRRVATPEWVMCKNLFMNIVSSKLQMALLLNDPPDDLKGY
jgi:hypothetical protein